MIEEDHCVYLKRSKKSVLNLSLYVDDILIAGNDMDSIVATKKWLSSTFKMKDMGEVHFMLGIEIVRGRPKKLLGLSQETYIKKILERFRMENSKPIDTLVEKGSALCLDECPKTNEEKKRMSTVPYVEAIGNLMYVMLCKRPDICFVISMMSRYQSNPGPVHWAAVKRIFRYLRGTTDFALCFHRGDLKLKDTVMLIGPVIEMSANPHRVMHSFLEAAYLSASRSRPKLPYLQWSLSMWHVQQLCKKLSG